MLKRPVGKKSKPCLLSPTPSPLIRAEGGGGGREKGVVVGRVKYELKYIECQVFSRLLVACSKLLTRLKITFNPI